MRLFFYLIICFSPIARSQNTIPKTINTKEKIGYIKFDPKIDNVNFFLCDEYNIMEYYQVNPVYNEGLKSINEYFIPHINYANNLCEEDGYLTVRFVINCKGKTDRYRATFVNTEYLKSSKNKELKKYIVNKIKKMSDWTSGNYEGKDFDSYYHINFKISDCKISEIYP